MDIWIISMITADNYEPLESNILLFKNREEAITKYKSLIAEWKESMEEYIDNFTEHTNIEKEDYMRNHYIGSAGAEKVFELIKTLSILEKEK